jgi:peptidoglycan/xylan/chitin deacetylase (PgdA/CDA1 family)
MNRNKLLVKSLEVGRKAGLFSLARKSTANVLRILCYHGFSLDDEHKYSPGMFVSANTLRSRMRLLRNQGYRILTLDEGVERLRTGTLEPDSVVITTDDGFYGTLALGAPIFHEFGYPSTLYITTYYLQHQTPVYNFLLINMFLRSDREWVELAHLAPGIPPRIKVRGRPTTDDNWRLVARAIDDHYAVELRDAVYQEVGQALGVDYKRLRDARMYHLLAPHELREVEKFGVDIQLHTHRHQLPEDEPTIRYEILRNREVLRELCSSRLDHLCYPSGDWREAHIPLLQSLGIKSATTCDIGNNRPGTHPLKLYRFLDRDNISTLRFEAEISGYMPLMRSATSQLKRVMDRK